MPRWASYCQAQLSCSSAVHAVHRPVPLTHPTTRMRAGNVHAGNPLLLPLLYVAALTALYVLQLAERSLTVAVRWDPGGGWGDASLRRARHDAYSPH
jgi:hypothetical protein